MSVFSGVMPVISTFPNSNINADAKGLLNNLAVTGLNATVGVAVSKAFGAQVASQLGLQPVGKSNFLSQIVTPGLISTGVAGLSQTLATSIRNSQALGPLGPLAGNLVDVGLNYGGKLLTDEVSKALGGSGESKGSLYFPGAGGPGEGEANFPANSSYPGKKDLHAISGPNGDITFSLVLVKDLAQLEAYDRTLNNPTPPQSSAPKSPPSETAPATTSGAPQTGGVPAGTPAAPATSTPPPAANNSGSAQASVATPNTPQQIGEAANKAATTETAGSNTGQPPPTTQGNAPSTPEQNKPAQEEKAPEIISWKFICPPEEISWETTFQAERVPIFGMNSAPVIGGVKSMRDLTLSNAIVEGFTRGKTVEDKIAMLEEALKMSIPMFPSGGQFVQIPVYRVYAGGKFYGRGLQDIEKGHEGGYFVIKSLKVQEKMRDFSGRTTRAMVDISLIQVPSYQVLTGRDIASPFLPSQKSVVGVIGEKVLANSSQIVKDAAAATAQADQKVKGGGGGSGNEGGGNNAGGAEQVRGVRPGSVDRIRVP